VTEDQLAVQSATTAVRKAAIENICSKVSRSGFPSTHFYIRTLVGILGGRLESSGQFNRAGFSRSGEWERIVLPNIGRETFTTFMRRLFAQGVHADDLSLARCSGQSFTFLPPRPVTHDRGLCLDAVASWYAAEARVRFLRGKRMGAAACPKRTQV